MAEKDENIVSVGSMSTCDEGNSSPSSSQLDEVSMAATKPDKPESNGKDDSAVDSESAAKAKDVSSSSPSVESLEKQTVDAESSAEQNNENQCPSSSTGEQDKEIDHVVEVNDCESDKTNDDKSIPLEQTQTTKIPTTVAADDCQIDSSSVNGSTNVDTESVVMEQVDAVSAEHKKSDENISSALDVAEATVEIELPLATIECPSLKNSSTNSNEMESKCDSNKVVVETAHTSGVDECVVGESAEQTATNNESSEREQESSSATDSIKLDSELKSNNVHVNEQKQTEASQNSFDDCDSSDILVENKIDESAIATDAKTHIDRDVVACEQNSEIDRPENKVNINASISVTVSEENAEHKGVVVEEQKNEDANFTKEQPNTNESNASRNFEANCSSEESNSDANVNSNKNNNNQNNVEQEASDKSKCAYEPSEIPTSPLVDCPIGFKDKFKKSLDIIEKSKQDSNSSSSDKENKRQVQATYTANEETADKSKCNEADANRMIPTQSSASASSAATPQQKHDKELVASNVQQNSNEQFTSKQTVEPSFSGCDSNDNYKNKKNNDIHHHQKVTIGGCSDSTMNSLHQTYDKIGCDKTNSLVCDRFDLSKHSPAAATVAHQSPVEVNAGQKQQNSEQVTKIIVSTRTIIVSPKSESQTHFSRNSATSMDAAATVKDPNPSKSSNLYVSNPDFSKSMRPSVCDLSELKMKPPDFSRISRSSELHVPNPDFTKAYDDVAEVQRLSPAIHREINPNNFAEYSKKYNFISDLQLKSPSTPATSCSPLYVKIPDFSSSKLRNQIESNESKPLEEPTPHIIIKNKYRLPASSSSKSNSSADVTHGSRSAHLERMSPRDVSVSMVNQSSQKQSSSNFVAAKHPFEMQSNVIQKTQTDSHAKLMPNIYTPAPSEQQKYEVNSSNSAGYGHNLNVHKPFSDDSYQQGLINSSVPHHYQTMPQQHIHPHMDQHMRTKLNAAPSQQPHGTYDYYHRPNEKLPIKSQTPDLNMSQQSNDHPMYGRVHPAMSSNHEQSRQHSNINKMNSNSSGDATFPTSQSNQNSPLVNLSSKTSSQTNKSVEYYNQMKPTNKWPNQPQRITQSPISTASSPLSISSQSTRISQSPVSVSPLPYHIQRQSPSNVYASPHVTPSSSPFGYPPPPSPNHMLAKSNRLPTANTQPNSNLPHSLYPAMNSSNYRSQPAAQPSTATPPMQSPDHASSMAKAFHNSKSTQNMQPNKLLESKVKMRNETNRYGDASHDLNRDYEQHQQQQPQQQPQQQQQQNPNNYRPNISSRHSTKSESLALKCADRIEYNRLNTIVDPYVYRQSSEADLNYQIIRKTLKKEIPTPAFNHKYAEQNMSSRANTHSSIPPQNINEKNLQRAKTTSDSKLMFPGGKSSSERDLNKLKYPQASYPTQSMPLQKSSDRSAYESTSKLMAPSTSSNYKNHQFSSTNQQNPPSMSSVQMPSMITSNASPNMQRIVDTSASKTYSERAQQPFDASMRSLDAKTSSAHTAKAAGTNLSVNDVSSTKPHSSTIFSPKKRESPLDLSVKTIKTKADSTGVYDYSLPSRRHNIPQSLKVDFEPNFSNSGSGRADDNNVPAAAMSNTIPMNYHNQLQANSQPLITQSAPPRVVEYQQQQRHSSPRTFQSTAIVDNKSRAVYDDNLQYSAGSSSGRSSAKLAPPPKSAAAEPKTHTDAKMPMIFGQKPEDLKNFTPEYNSYHHHHHQQQQQQQLLQQHQFSDASMRKESLKMNKPNDREQQYQVAVPYQAMNSAAPKPIEYPRRSESTPSDIIQYASHAHRPPMHHQSQPAPHQLHQPMNYPQYSHEMHRPQPPQPQTSLVAYPKGNKIMGEQSKVMQEMADNMSKNPHVLPMQMQRKRYAETEAFGANPMKQVRYDQMGNEKCAPRPNQIDASHYAETSLKPSGEKAIGMPVIVQPQTTHLKSFEPQYNQYSQNFNVNPSKNHNSQAFPSRAGSSFDLSETKVSTPYPHLPSNYGREFLHAMKSDTKQPFDEKPTTVSTILPNRTISNQQQQPATYNNMYPQPYHAEASYSTKSNESIPTNAAANLNNRSNNNNTGNSVDSNTSDNNNNTDNNNGSAATNSVNNSGAPKSIDRSVILKLRTNLEIKEIEKQKALRINGAEKAEEETSKSDIASILAARIRTKAELKGFTVPIKEPKENAASVFDFNEFEPTTSNAEPLSKDNSAAGFDLMDWGMTCNDFLEQLQSGSKKRQMKAPKKSKSDDFNTEKKGTDSPIASETKGDRKGSDCSDKSSKKKQKTVESSETSSDEDKPLHLLRQQSLNEGVKNSKNSSTNEIDADSTASVASSRKHIRKLSEKRTKGNIIEKHCNKQSDGSSRKNTAIDSSSDSDEETERNSQRFRKLIRKPRTRSSFGSKLNVDDDESDTTSIRALNNNGNGKKRNLKLKSSSESEVDANRNSKKKKSLELNSDSDDDVGSSSNDSPKKQPKAMKVEETMTRSKRKRELEMEIANSKVLRNDKMIKCNDVTADRKSARLSTQENKKPATKSTEQIGSTNQRENSKNPSPSKSLLRGKPTDGKRKSDEMTKALKPTGKRDAKEQSSSSAEESSSSSSDGGTVVERLRSRRCKLNNSSLNPDQNEKSEKGNISSSSLAERGDGKGYSKKVSKLTPKKSTAELEMSEESRSQFPPGWEEQAYEYKRSLKIPPRLITIGRPSWHRKSTSLPDLDPHHSSDASETFSEINKKYAMVNAQTDRAPSAGATKGNRNSEKPVGENSMSTITNGCVSAAEDSNSKSKSIIDLLHQRVIRPTERSKKARTNNAQHEPRILPRSNEVELLPTPGDKGSSAFKPDNVFETAVLKSRTRKEYKAIKTQEIIREVFGGEEHRPASAPPYNFEVVKQQQLQQQQKQKQQLISNQLTFDQQYEQYLEKMNVDYGEKIRKVKNAPGAKSDCDLMPKIKKIDEDSMNPDDESQDMEVDECLANRGQIKEETCQSLDDASTTVGASFDSERMTPISFTSALQSKKSRANRHSRRKGSSGFDYIRKKKRPLQANADGTPINPVKRRSAAVNYLEFKDENDITREIRSWVLNKGVGESVLHKAARLGYIDVVAYCLERLDMQPDQKDNAGYTPLHEACSRGLVDIARILLQYGANHSETAHSGIRPLHEAVDNGYLEIVRLLLSYGADPLLATYAGQTPIMLAEDDDEMVAFLKNHLYDVQNTGPNKQPWKFNGSWKIDDLDDVGYDVFEDIPGVENSSKKSAHDSDNVSSTSPTRSDRPPKRKALLRQRSRQKDFVGSNTDPNGKLSGKCTDSDSELFEIEESDAPLIPSYQIRDEGASKWVLLSDLCYLLKIKSKDTLMKLLCPGSSPAATASQKDLLRELKMSEFLEKAICLQLLCAGEKLNIRSSKVTLVKYTDSVKNLLGVKTIKLRL